MKSSNWSHHELKMINHVEVFNHKPSIMKKAETFLRYFEKGMAQELQNIPPGILPAKTKTEKGHLVRGENLLGFPFLSLDIPQFFTREEMFTYRTLFWWGHYLGYSLILKGERLKDYSSKLAQLKNEKVCSGMYLCIAPVPWEWTWTKDNYLHLPDASSETIHNTIIELNYIKLCRFFPTNDPSFPALDWTTEGLKTWRDYLQITR